MEDTASGLAIAGLVVRFGGDFDRPAARDFFRARATAKLVQAIDFEPPKGFGVQKLWRLVER